MPAIWLSLLQSGMVNAHRRVLFSVAVFSTAGRYCEVLFLNSTTRLMILGGQHHMSLHFSEPEQHVQYLRFLYQHSYTL